MAKALTGDLLQKIEAAVGKLSPLLKTSLSSSSSDGYAYEAWVLTESQRLSGARWVHPDYKGVAVFATGAGGGLATATQQRSWLELNDNAIVQGLTVNGRSGASHKLDLAQVHPWWYPARIWRVPGPHPDEPYEVLATAECKNTSAVTGIEVARAALGLWMDIDSRRAWPPHYPVGRPRVSIVAAERLSSHASKFHDEWLGKVSASCEPLKGTALNPWWI